MAKKLIKELTNAIDAEIKVGEDTYLLHLKRGDKKKERKLSKELEASQTLVTLYNDIESKKARCEARDEILQKRIEIEEDPEKLGELLEQRMKNLDLAEELSIESSKLFEQLRDTDQEQVFKKMALMNISEDSIDTAENFAASNSWKTLYEIIKDFWARADKGK